jgi:hypothetical protein
MVALHCPYCAGRVKTLIGGLRQEFAGRQKVCVACGAIWRLDSQKYRTLLGGFGLMTFVGAIVPYAVTKPRHADFWCIGWLVFCVAVLWPLVYYIVWKWKLRR